MILNRKTADVINEIHETPGAGKNDIAEWLTDDKDNAEVLSIIEWLAENGFVILKQGTMMTDTIHVRLTDEGMKLQKAIDKIDGLTGYVPSRENRIKTWGYYPFPR